MESLIYSAVLVGLESRRVEINARFVPGAPGKLSIAGVSEAVAREIRVRVQSAFEASGYDWPAKHCLVEVCGLEDASPSTSLDLPIAVAVAVTAGYVPAEVYSGATVIGELRLDGRVLPPRGLIAHARQMLRDEDADVLIAAADGVALPGLDVRDVATLREALDPAHRRAPVPPAPAKEGHAPDLAEIRGHARAKRALEIAAAGHHSLLLIGPPGVGKTMLARRLPGLMPEMGTSERCELQTIQDASGRTLAPGRPFRAPHHTASLQALLGGGPRNLLGEISLAHLGVLFLDEITEFRRRDLEQVFMAAKAGRVLWRGDVRLPADVLIVGAANPCPCGFKNTDRCRCTPSVLAIHDRRLAAIRKMFDLVVYLEGPILTTGETGETSEAVQKRVTQSHVCPTKSLLSEESAAPIAQTIACLESASCVTADHMDEARSFLSSE